MTRQPVRQPRLCVGCSGWNYKSWRGPFYPSDLPQSRWLSWYSDHFQTVEINNSFYRLPERETFAGWKGQTPPGFVFAVKASRFLTHMKQLRNPEEPLERLFSHARGLGRKLGPVLYQLPERLHCDLDRLVPFLDALPRGVQHVIEFRHPSWYVSRVFDLLERRRVALCLHDKDGSSLAGPFVGPFVYIRYHGTSGRYHGSYGDEVLDAWAERLTGAWREGRDVYAYFNNDPEAEAVRNAKTLQKYASARLKRTLNPS